jgi:hypothetical protein
MNAIIALENFLAWEVPELEDRLLVRLQAIRYIVNEPIFVTSGHRPGDVGAHGRGLAVDISDNRRGAKISSTWRFKVITSAYSVGITRIGDYDRHIHIDVDPSLPQNVLWYGISN